MKDPKVKEEIESILNQIGTLTDRATKLGCSVNVFLIERSSESLLTRIEGNPKDILLNVVSFLEKMDLNPDTPISVLTCIAAEYARELILPQTNIE